MSKKDFTLDGYRNLLDLLKHEGFTVIRVKDYFLNSYKKESFCIIRHDVDRRPKNALAMAKIEAEMGVRSTYYFRTKTFLPEIIRKISSMGHEIGYHYEVIDKAKGDFWKALCMLKDELKEFRSYVSVVTCSAHGNPLTKHENSTLWDYFEIEKFDLFNHAEKVVGCNYITDNGRGYKEYSSKEVIQSNMKSDNLYFNIHPERWNDGLNWYWQWLFDLGCNQVKRVMKYAGLTYKSPVSC